MSRFDLSRHGDAAKDWAVGTVAILLTAWCVAALVVGSIVLAQRIAEAVQ